MTSAKVKVEHNEPSLCYSDYNIIRTPKNDAHPSALIKCHTLRITAYQITGHASHKYT